MNTASNQSAFSVTTLKSKIRNTLAVLFAACFLGALPVAHAEEVEANAAAEFSYAKVSINAAPAEQLAEMLNGVGAKKAAAIVAWRDAHGEFTSIDDLALVKGIGAATIEKNRSKLTL